jgi:hypothetical protein
MSPTSSPPEVVPAGSIPEALPATPPVVLPAQPPRAAVPPQRARRNPVLRGFGFLFGWLWRLAAGAVMCFNWFILSYLTSIVAFGWTYRWMQALVLRGWWKQSPRRHDGSFQDFCDSLGQGGPSPRPRWFLRERIGALMSRPGPDGRPAGALRLIGRALTVPWHSFWVNFKTGLAGIFCTYLLTGWGCLLMVFGWEFGWFNSINRYYEQYLIGPGLFFLGLLLFILAMFYVPMAQAHQAATGQARAFFEFRFVRRLVRARLTAYVGLAMLMGFASFVLTIVVIAGTLNPEFLWNDATLSPQEVRAGFWLYLFLFTLLLLFPLYLLQRYVAAVIYRSAVLKALRKGTVTRAELNPVLAGWLEKLDLKVVPRLETAGLGWYARLTTRFAYRRVLFTVLFFVWLFFATRLLLHHFLRAHPVVTYMNQPMIQMPCFDFIPEHLYSGRNE